MAKEFRCTRITPYGEPYAKGTPGEKDKTARIGYYVVAKDEIDAYNQMAGNHPEDVCGKPLTETFTVDFNREVKP